MSALVKKKLKAARTAISEKNYKDGYSLSKDVLEWDSENYNALVFLGISCQNLKKIEECEEAYNNAINVDRDQILAWQGLSALYEETKNNEKLILVLQELQKIHLNVNNNKKAYECIKKEMKIYKDAKNLDMQINLWSFIISQVSTSTFENLPKNQSDDFAQEKNMILSKINDGWPDETKCLKEIIELMEANNSINIEKEVKKRRNRLGAPPLNTLIIQVKNEIIQNSNLFDFYERLLEILEKKQNLYKICIKDLIGKLDFSQEIDMNDQNTSTEFFVFGNDLALELQKENTIDYWEKCFDILLLKAFGNCSIKDINIRPNTDFGLSINELNKLETMLIFLVANKVNGNAHRLFVDILDLNNTNNILSRVLVQYTKIFGKNDPFGKASFIYLEKILQNPSDYIKNLLNNNLETKNNIDINKQSLENDNSFKYEGSIFLNYVDTKQFIIDGENDYAIESSRKAENCIKLLEDSTSLKLPRTLVAINLELATAYFGLGKVNWKKSKKLFESCIDSPYLDYAIDSAIQLSKMLVIEEDYDTASELLIKIEDKIKNDSNSFSDLNTKASLKVKGELGKVYLLQGKADLAQAIISETLQQMPEWVDGKLAMGDIYTRYYLSSKDNSYRIRAFREYIEAAKLDPNNENAFLKLAEWYKVAEKIAIEKNESEKNIFSHTQRKIGCYKKVYLLNPGNRIAAEAMFEYVVSNNEPSNSSDNISNALEILNQTIESNKNQPWAWQKKGFLLLNYFHDFNQAMDTFFGAIKTVGNDPSIKQKQILFMSFEGLSQVFYSKENFSSGLQAALRADVVLSEIEQSLNFCEPDQTNENGNSIWGYDEIMIRKSQLRSLQGQICFSLKEYNNSINYYLEAEDFAKNTLLASQITSEKLKFSLEKRKSIVKMLLTRINNKLIGSMLRQAAALRSDGLFTESREIIANALEKSSTTVCEQSSADEAFISIAPWSLIFDASNMLYDCYNRFVGSTRTLENNSLLEMSKSHIVLLESAVKIINHCLEFFNQNYPLDENSSENPKNDNDQYNQESEPTADIINTNRHWLRSTLSMLSNLPDSYNGKWEIECILALMTVSSTMMVILAPSISLASMAWNNLSYSYYIRTVVDDELTIVSGLPFYAKDGVSMVGTQETESKVCLFDRSISSGVEDKLGVNCENNEARAGNNNDLLKKALFCVQAALQLEPTMSMAVELLSRISFKLKLFKLTQHALISCIILNQSSAYAWSNMGIFYMKMGYNDLASKCLKTSFNCDPESITAAYGLGILNYFYLGNSQKGYIYLIKCLDLGGSSNLGAVLAYSLITWRNAQNVFEHNIQNAIFYLTKACEQYSNNPICFYLLGLLLEESGDFHLSKKMFQMAYELFDQDPSFQYNIKNIIRKQLILGIFDFSHNDSNDEMENIHIHRGFVDTSLRNFHMCKTLDNAKNSVYIQQLLNITDFTESLELLLDKNVNSKPKGRFIDEMIEKIADSILNKLQLNTLEHYARNCCAVGEYDTAVQMYYAVIQRTDIDAIIVASDINKNSTELEHLLCLVVGFGKSLFLSKQYAEGVSQFESAIKLANHLVEIDFKHNHYKRLVDVMLSQILWALETPEHRNLAYKHLYESVFPSNAGIQNVISNFYSDLKTVYSVAESLKLLFSLAIAFGDKDLTSSIQLIISKIPFKISVHSRFPLLIALSNIIVNKNFLSAKRYMEKSLLMSPQNKDLWIQLSFINYLFCKLHQNCLYSAFMSSSGSLSISSNPREKASNANFGSIDKNDQSKNVETNRYIEIFEKQKNIKWTRIDSLIISCLSELMLGMNHLDLSTDSGELFWTPSIYTSKYSIIDIEEDLKGLSVSEISGILENNVQKLDSVENEDSDLLIVKKATLDNFKVAEEIMFGSNLEMNIKKAKFKAAKAIMLKPNSKIAWQALSTANAYHLRYLVSTKTTTTLYSNHIADSSLLNIKDPIRKTDRIEEYAQNIFRNLEYTNKVKVVENSTENHKPGDESHDVEYTKSGRLLFGGLNSRQIEQLLSYTNISEIYYKSYIQMNSADEKEKIQILKTNNLIANGIENALKSLKKVCGNENEIWSGFYIALETTVREMSLNSIKFSSKNETFDQDIINKTQKVFLKVFDNLSKVLAILNGNDDKALVLNGFVFASISSARIYPVVCQLVQNILILEHSLIIPVFIYLLFLDKVVEQCLFENNEGTGEQDTLEHTFMSQVIQNQNVNLLDFYKLISDPLISTSNVLVEILSQRNDSNEQSEEVLKMTIEMTKTILLVCHGMSLRENKSELQNGKIMGFEELVNIKTMLLFLAGIMKRNAVAKLSHMNNGTMAEYEQRFDINKESLKT
ncbi:hypothetical protein BB558_004199 [Smittium angustum]|uniref:Uncharacterized protein n=1 Tax=Smittium angustum TaxID=133377 RepID=A0A2U1J400_SMIAN|nr:hypothetical protein BB558_004199 [Smittium angustum]